MFESGVRREQKRDSGSKGGVAAGSGDGRFGVTAAWGDGAVASEGVCRTPAHKDSGSRQNSWELLRERLKNVMEPEGPCLFMFNNCRQFIQTVLVLPRDEIDMDDMDSAPEDQVWGLGFALGTKGRMVPQPLRASLFLRNTWLLPGVLES